mmetsp:Transcript_2192/g.3305  ORF Transcript_2192/g.3305 Transcript_2192/m.3305 type:complete len:105 (-) Transcript_2192:479-793(-)
MDIFKDREVSPHAHNKIIYRVMQLGERNCGEYIKEFNECCRGKSLAMLMCKSKYEASQKCIHHFLNDDNVALVEKRWVEAGRPRKVNWEQLLDGIEEKGKAKLV